MTTSTRATARGSGRIFKPKNSVNWHCAYYRHGKEIRESTSVACIDPDPKDANKKKALAFLRAKVDAVRAERAGGPQMMTPEKRRITVNQLLDGLKADYEARGKWSSRVESNLRAVRIELGEIPALAMTKAMVNNYIAKGREKGWKPSTANRRVQLLLQSYRIAELTAPRVPRLSEIGNERKGFFERNDFLRVLAHLPDYLQDLCRFAYLTGWRKGALTSLTWADVDAEKIYLRAEHSKNRKPVTVPLCGELTEIIARRRAGPSVKGATGEMVPSDFVFHRQGQPVGDFRKAWATATKASGCAGRLFHDLRRTAARNLVANGTPENVAMQITGHRTASMFRRYSIVSEQQKEAALSALSTLQPRAATQENAVRVQ